MFAIAESPPNSERAKRFLHITHEIKYLFAVDTPPLPLYYILHSERFA